MTPLTVLQVIPALDAGGAERGAVDVAAGLAAAGGKALIATSGGRLAEEAAAKGGRIIILPLASKNPLTLALNTRRLRQLIRTEKVDLIHARSRAPAWSAYAAAQAEGIPYLATFHGTYGASNALKRAYNSVMLKGRKTIAISRFVHDHIIAAYTYPADRIVTIPRGIDFARFDPKAVSADRTDAFRAQAGLNRQERRPVLLLPGRLTRWKGQDVAIKALASLETQKPVLILAGDAQGRDGYEAELRRLADGLGLGDRVRITGHVSDMPAAYAAADLVLSPASTKAEAFGRVPVEAQAMEKLPVATAHGGATETVEDGVTGFLALPDDPQSLAAALRRALALTPDQRLALGRAARVRAAADYDVKVMVARTLALYAELTGRAGT